jgi:hypothetical protein
MSKELSVSAQMSFELPSILLLLAYFSNQEK